MKPRRSHFGNHAPNKTQQRVALQSLLVMRRTLDGVDPDSLSRSYGLPVPEIVAMLESERLRRLSGARG